MRGIDLYAAALGITATTRDDRRVEVVLPASDDVAGRTGLLHAGALTGLLDVAAQLLARELSAPPAWRPVSMTVEFLRPARLVGTTAAATIASRSRRLLLVHTTAWQEDASRPVAAARWRFVRPLEEDEPQSAARRVSVGASSGGIAGGGP